MSWFSRLKNMLQPGKLDDELSEELRFHLDSREQQFQKEGMTPEQARRQARLQFHGVDRVTEACREENRIPWLEVAGRDLRYAARSLRASPLFTAAAVLSLALGIGANTAVFTLLYASLWKPLPVPEPDQLVHLIRGNPPQPNEEGNYSYALYRLIAEALNGRADLIAKSSYVKRRFGLDISSTERAIGEAVSGNYFAALRVSPFAGRLLQPQDDSAGGDNRGVVLSHAFWTRRFASDPKVLGSTVFYNEKPFVVVGVAAEGFTGVEAEAAVDLWISITAELTPRALASINYNSLRLLARLRPGVRPDQVQAAADRAFRAHLESEILPHLPGYYRPKAAAQHITARPASAGFSVMGRSYERPLKILLAVVVLVLLISCANVANLVMARNAARMHEFRLRFALGAGRARIAGQLLAETLLLALAGATGGLLLAMWGCHLAMRLLPNSTVAPAFDFTPNATVLAFTAAAAILTAALFGVAPALRATGGDIGPGSTSGARTTRRRTSAAQLLVAGQLAISLVLLIGAGLFLGTVRNFQAIDLGFEPDRLLTFRLSFPRNTPPAQIERVYSEVQSGVAVLPGVVAASYDTGGGWSATVQVEGRPFAADQDNEVGVIAAGPGWFETIGLQLLEGRYLNARDAADLPAVVVVNARLARRYFGNESALGHRMKFNVGGDRPQLREIVGVVRDAKHYGVKARDWPMVFLPTLRDGSFIVRTQSEVAGMSNALHSVVAAAGGGAQIERIRPYRDEINDSLDRERMIAVLSTVFGGLATLLAAIGLYGVLAYGVSKRMPEMGIRMAMGAQPRDVMWLVLRQTSWVIALGTAAGLIAAAFSTRFLATMLYGVKPLDATVFAGAALMLAAVATLAGWLPARRAARIEPTVALRYE